MTTVVYAGRRNGNEFFSSLAEQTDVQIVIHFDCSDDSIGGVNLICVWTG